MNKKKRGILIAVIAVIAAAAGFGTYKYLNQDLTGMTAQEIIAFKEAHPKVNVTYTVTIEGGEAPLLLNGDTHFAELTTPAQADDLAAKKDYFPAMKVIYLGSTHITSAQLDALYDAFPDAAIGFNYVNVLGEAVPSEIKWLDWSDLALSDLDRAIADIKHLTALHTIELRSTDGMSNLSLDDALAIHEAYPNVHIGYAVQLFGQTITTDMTELIFDHVQIGDEGVAELRRLLPLMDKLTYLKLDDCGTTDETMAQLREDFPDIEVHWRIFFSNFNVMTDNYKVWAGGLSDKHTEVFTHLRSTRYMDLGHNSLTNLDFCKNLPDLEVLIVAIGHLEDISALENCTKLEYLELMCNTKLDDEDMAVLAGLTNIEHLNIGAMSGITNLSFTDNMTKLKRLHCTMNPQIPQEEIDRFMALHPDCEVNFSDTTDPIDGGWRFNPGGVGTYDARYLLLREQIGYIGLHVSRYPLGELKEAVTYESTGITPEQ